MSTQVPVEQETWDPKLGPAPLPTWHGKGCTCNQFPCAECPAADTEEGKRRTALRQLNGARIRVRNAEHALQNATAELSAARAALTVMESEYGK